jgi:hypothetical protein
LCWVMFTTPMADHENLFNMMKSAHTRLSLGKEMKPFKIKGKMRLPLMAVCMGFSDYMQTVHKMKSVEMQAVVNHR